MTGASGVVMTASIVAAPARVLRSIVALAWGPLLVVPFPYRVAVVLTVLVLLLSWALRGALPRLLSGLLKLSDMVVLGFGTALVMPPGALSLWMRRRNGRPVASSVVNVYGNVVGAAVSAWESLTQQLGKMVGRPRRFWPWWGVVLGVVAWVSWNYGPCVAGGQMMPRLQSSASWWASMEAWVINGDWIPQAAPMGTTVPMCQQRPVAMRLLVPGD